MNLVQYNNVDRLGIITMNRPEKRNALSFEMVSELKAAFLAAENDAGAKVIILKANGDTFCAGADLAYLQRLQQFSFDENLEDSRHLANLFRQVYTLKKVVIAQVQGHALAGGCGLATVCDFVFAIPEAKFGYTEVRIGFVPAIVMIFLIRKIGEQKARHLLLSGELVSREKAVNIGLVHQLAAREELDGTVREFAQRLIQGNSSQSMALTKEMIDEIQSRSFEAGLEYATMMNAKARGSEDCKKGIQAFLGKTDIVW
jgi:methylglutaconyl-CoA hydratase